MRSPKLKVAPARAGLIVQQVDDLLKQIGCSTPPVPVEKVAEAIGTPVVYAPYEGDDLAGMLIRHNGAVVVAVNSAHHKNRQRFTIAHECGHYLLEHKSESHVDRGFSVLFRDEQSGSATNMHEVEANFFAAELLMPREFLFSDLSSLNLDYESDEAITKLARRYAVSPQAMTYRIANLLQVS